MMDQAAALVHFFWFMWCVSLIADMVQAAVSTDAIKKFSIPDLHVAIVVTQMYICVT